MINIPASDLITYWNADNIPAAKEGLLHSFITKCFIDEKKEPMKINMVIKSKYIIHENKVMVFNCISEKNFNLYKVRSMINSELILKLILQNNLEFDIYFNIKKFGTTVAFAKLPKKINDEFIEEAILVSTKLNEMQSF